MTHLSAELDETRRGTTAPRDQAALARNPRDIEHKRARQRQAVGSAKGEADPPGKLVASALIQGWTQALNALPIAYPGRLRSSFEDDWNPQPTQTT